MNPLDRLKDWQTTVNMFCSDRCKQAGINHIKTLCQQYGYDFAHYQQTGSFRLLLESVTNKPPEKLHCLQCNTEIQKPRENQKFCNPICKNKYHNSKKPK